MPPYRTPVVRKPKPRKPAPASGAAAAVAAAVRTGTRAAARPTPRARPKPTPAPKRVKARVKANPKPKPYVLKGAGDSKAKALQNRQSKKQKQTDAGKALAGTLTRATAKATAPHKLTKPVKSEPGLGGLSKADVAKKNAVGYYDPHGAQGQEAGIDKAIHSTTQKILAQTTRVTHAEAGAVRAAIKGENVPKAALRGIKNKDKYTFSDALDAAGVHNKIVKGAVGLGLDVGLDPTTYVTLGAGVGPKIALKASEKAEKKALAQGLSKQQAKNFGQMAARQSKKDGTRGIQLGARGGIPFTDKRFDVKTSGAKTAAAGRKLKKGKAGQKAAAVSQHVRTALHESVAPDVTPAFRSRAEHEAIRAAERRTRAVRATGEKRAQRRTQAYAKVESDNPAEALKTVDAIERKRIGTLPDTPQTASPKPPTGRVAKIVRKVKPAKGKTIPSQQQVARSYVEDFKTQEAAKTSRGIGMKFTPEGPRDAQDFWPHELTPAEAKNVRTKGKRKPAEDKRRQLRVPLVEAIRQKPGRYIEQPHIAYGAETQETVHNVALADLWQHVASTGKPYKAHTSIGPDESVYKVTPTGPVKVERKGEAAALKDKKNRYVVLNDHSVSDVLQSIPQRGRNVFTRTYDKIQGTTKKLQTLYNPAYYLRNLTGDSILGWQADTNLKSFRQSVSGTRALRARNKAEASPEAIVGPGKETAKAQKLLDRGLDLKKSGKSTLGEELALAERHGAISTGQVQTDIRNQIGKVQDGKVWRANEAREDFPRFATYLSARKRGMNPDDAAAYSLKKHIDYADLTPGEKIVARRAFQFYTFAARNTRLQAGYLITRPGKAATVQKVLEEASKVAGFGSYADWSSTLPDYNQKGLPIPVKVGSRVFPVFISPPQTDLSQLSLSPKEQTENILNRATFFKSLPELAVNYSVFFQGPIQPTDHVRTVAPRGIQHLLDIPLTRTFAKDVLGLKPIKDKRSGRMVWGWYRKADYASRMFPQSNFGVASAKPAPDDRGLNGVTQVLSFLTGIKVAPDKTQDNRVNAASQKLHVVADELSNLRDEGVNADHPNDEYRDLLKTQRRLQVKVRRLKVKRGDAVVPKTGAPRKGRSGPKTIQQELEDFQKESRSKSTQDEINDFASGR